MAEYIEELRERGVDVLPTDFLELNGPDGVPGLYTVQALIPANRQVVAPVASPRRSVVAVEGPPPPLSGAASRPD